MTYPEVAAGGLWSTASDVARFVIELQKSFAGKSNRVLSTDLTRQMLSTQTPDWGLGIQVLAEGTIFLHTGSNLGYRCIFIGYPHTGEGAVVMTNAEGGQELRMEILRSIAVEYGWPLLRVAGYPAATPLLATSNAAVNGASNLPVLAPGLVVSLYGPDLADVTEVVFNGIPATVLASSANQINTVLPANLEPGPALVQVKRAGIASAGRIVKVDQYAPGIFSLNQRGEGPGMIVHADTLGLVSEADPARRGQHLSILCTGLGTGAEPTVTLGEVATHVLWSGPMPDVPGVNKVDIQVPEDAPRGATVQVLLRVGGAVSNSVTLAVE